VNNLHNK